MGVGRACLPTRDHDGADVGVVELGDDGGGVAPQRVDHHRQAAELQPRLQLLLRQAGGGAQVDAAR